MKLFNRFETSQEELRDLLKAWVIIAGAFALAMARFKIALLWVFPIALVTIGIGFLFHEMGHKIVAQSYGLWAEFRADMRMLWMALGMSALLGFFFAAPGAVRVEGSYASDEQIGKIKAAGPLTNLMLALAFLLSLLITPWAWVKMVASYGIIINILLGLFNLIPIWHFDGRGILNWNKAVYGMMVGIFLLGFLLLRFLKMGFGG